MTLAFDVMTCSVSTAKSMAQRGRGRAQVQHCGLAELRRKSEFMEDEQLKFEGQNTSEEGAIQRKNSRNMHKGSFETLAYKAALLARMRFHEARQNTICVKGANGIVS